jgi:hypothetical protein
LKCSDQVEILDSKPRFETKMWITPLFDGALHKPCIISSRTSSAPLKCASHIRPTNRVLLDAASPPQDEEALILLAEWARLRAVRTRLTLLGFLVLLAQSIQQR